VLRYDSTRTENQAETYNGQPGKPRVRPTQASRHARERWDPEGGEIHPHTAWLPQTWAPMRVQLDCSCPHCGGNVFLS